MKEYNTNYSININNSDILFVLAKNNNIKNNKLTNVCAKIAVLNGFVENDLFHMAKLINSMNIDKLFIFSIVISETFEYKTIEINSPCRIRYIEVGSSFFINTFLQNPDNINFWEYNEDTLYILRNGNYSDITELISVVQNTNAQVVRGSSKMSYRVSPIDFRLSCYLMILFNMDYKRFNYENSFNILTKDRYLPSYK